MTKEEREEAIYQLERCIHNAKVSGNKYSHFELAIEALKVEPCEDAISRQAVIEGINRYIKKAQSTGSKDDFISFEELVVKELPSVNPQEPKTGHWKRISFDKYSEHAKYWYRCDRCGNDNLGNTDWCPNCGCRMVEPQESEEV